MKNSILFFLMLTLLIPCTGNAEEVIAVGTGQLIRADDSKNEFSWAMIIYRDKSIEIILSLGLNEADFDKYEDEILSVSEICGYGGKDYTMLGFCPEDIMPDSTAALINVIKDKIALISKLKMLQNMAITLMAEKWPILPERKDNNEPEINSRMAC